MQYVVGSNKYLYLCKYEYMEHVFIFLQLRSTSSSWEFCELLVHPAELPTCHLPPPPCLLRLPTADWWLRTVLYSYYGRLHPCTKNNCRETSSLCLLAFNSIIKGNPSILICLVYQARSRLIAFSWIKNFANCCWFAHDWDLQQAKWSSTANCCCLSGCCCFHHIWSLDDFWSIG